MNVVDRPVFLLGMPRSGTTWLSQLVESHPSIAVRLSPIYSYAFKDQLTPTSTAGDWRRILQAVLDSDDEFTTQDWQRRRGNLPRFGPSSAATTLAIKDTRFHETYLQGMRELPAARCVYLVRDPRAVLDSWRRSPEFPDGAWFEDVWCTGGSRKTESSGEHWGFDDWLTLTTEYVDLARSHPGRFVVVRFEDLVRHTEETLTELMSFIGESVHPDMIAFASESHGRHDDDPYSVYKDPDSVLHGWERSFPPDIGSKITERAEAAGLAEFLA